MTKTEISITTNRIVKLLLVVVDAVNFKLSNQESILRDALAWVVENKATIPECVYLAINLLFALRADLERTKQRASKLLTSFRVLLGVIPKAERTPTPPSPANIGSPSGKTCEEKLAALKARRAKLLAEIRRYEDRLGKGRQKGQKKSNKSAPGASMPVCDVVYQTASETVFSGNLARAIVEAEKLGVGRPENFENPRGLHATSDDRTRYEYGVTTKTINLQVETVTDPRTGKSVTASTDEIGPPNSQATWTAIANTIIAVIGYAIPINRLATMLKDSCPYFSSSRLCSYLKMAAEFFAPIYTHLGESLSDLDQYFGDDSKTRVVELNQAMREGGEVAAAAEDSLIGKVANIFGRVFGKKRGKGRKRSVNISVVIGKTKVEDPRSYIYFFRTHLGSFGDLMTKILEMRDPKKKSLTIVADMATTNLVSSKISEKFNIAYAGCAAHARRPFWRYKDKDQKLCYWMLSAFLVIEQIEDRIDELGRTRERILRYRQRYSRKIWRAILKRCESVIRGEKIYGYYWPKTSEIGKACAYIIKHYSELTRYLENPHIPSNNNLSERVLRWDKIMLDSSKFRKTELGRLQVDILRTIVHTCSAAEVDLRTYLVFIFKNRAKIEENPGLFTPYAYALNHGKSEISPK